MKASLDVFDGDKFAKDLLKSARAAIKATAKQVPIDQTQRISLRVTPQGAAQQANTPATAKAKRARLGHSIPLRDQGVLATPSKYKTKKEGASNYRISLPPSRANILPYLRQLHYRYWEISPEIKTYLQAALQTAIDHMRRQAQSYAKTKGA